MNKVVKEDEATATIKKHQSDIVAASQKVAVLEAAIRREEENIATANAAIVTAVLSPHEREEILADIALGKATEVDLEAFDRKAREEEATVVASLAAVKPTAQNAQQAIDGLKRRLADAQIELSALKGEFPQVRDKFLLAQAEALGVDYMAIAQRLVDIFKQLVAIDQIMGYPSRICGHKTADLCIPLFRVSACDNQDTPVYQFQFKAPRTMWTGEEMSAAVTAERERIRALGIEL